MVQRFISEKKIKKNTQDQIKLKVSPMGGSFPQIM